MTKCLVRAWFMRFNPEDFDRTLSFVMTTRPSGGRADPDPHEVAMASTRLAPLPASCHATDGEVVEGRDGVGLRPQPHATGPEARVAVIQVQGAVEPGLDTIAHDHDAHHVPLTEGRCFHAGGGELAAAAVVVVKPEVALERVGPDHVVLAVDESE